MHTLFILNLYSWLVINLLNHIFDLPYLLISIILFNYWLQYILHTLHLKINWLHLLIQWRNIGLLLFKIIDFFLKWFYTIHFILNLSNLIIHFILNPSKLLIHLILNIRQLLIILTLNISKLLIHLILNISKLLIHLILNLG